MPVVVSGDAATRLIRALKNAGGDTPGTDSVSEVCGDKDHHFGVLDTQVSSTVPSVTLLTQTLPDGQPRTADGGARDYHGHVFKCRDPDTEIVLDANVLGRLGLYNGSVVQVLILHTIALLGASSHGQLLQSPFHPCCRAPRFCGKQPIWGT